MSTPWSSVERPGSTQHQSGRRSEPSEAHGGLDRLDAKLRMRGWCQGRLCRRAAVDRPLTPAPQPNTTIQAIKTDTHDPARHLMVATELKPTLGDFVCHDPTRSAFGRPPSPFGAGESH